MPSRIHAHVPAPGLLARARQPAAPTLTPAMGGFFGTDRFAGMDGATFINAGRGATVDVRRGYRGTNEVSAVPHRLDARDQQVQGESEVPVAHLLDRVAAAGVHQVL